MEKPHSLHVHGLLAALTTLGDEKPPSGRQGLGAGKPPGAERCAPERPAGGSIGQREASPGRPWKPLERGWEGPRRRGLNSDSR